MASSVLLLLALAAAPADSHKFSTSQVRDAEQEAPLKGDVPGDAGARLTEAGLASVKAGARSGDARTKLEEAGLAATKAGLRGDTATKLTGAGVASVMFAARDARAFALSESATTSVREAARGLTSAARSTATVLPVSGIAGSSAATVTLAGGTGTPSPSVLPATNTSASATPSSSAGPTATVEPLTDLSNVGGAAARAGAEALRSAALALGANPDGAKPQAVDVEALLAKGVEALKAKDAETAVTELAACVEADPSRTECRWELGWAYSLDGHWAEALEQWTQVQKLQPDHPDLETALAQARGQATLQYRLTQKAPPTPRPPPPPGAKVRIRATGDVMLGTTVPEGFLPPDGAASVIAGVRPLLEDADLTFINLEGPLCDNGKTTKCRSPANCYAFRSPTSFGQYLKEAGVDLASTANNHSGDFGEECRRETESTLDAQGIAWSGPPGSIATVERNGLRIGMVAFHTSASCNHLNNLVTATGLVRAAAAENDIVIVSFHGGAEGSKALHVPKGREKFFGEDRGDLRVFTKAMVDAGAHLVLGHGPHVARAMEFYKGRLIAYSMGNFATYGRFNLKGPQGLGMVLEVELDREGRFTAGRILPTKQVGEGISMPDPSNGVIKQVRQLTEEDFPDTGARISDDGTLKPRGRPSSASM